jgi:hypothetical protein
MVRQFRLQTALWLALAAALGGCVAYPASPGYGYGYGGGYPAPSYVAPYSGGGYVAYGGGYRGGRGYGYGGGHGYHGGYGHGYGGWRH